MISPATPPSRAPVLTSGEVPGCETMQLLMLLSHGLQVVLLQEAGTAKPPKCKTRHFIHWCYVHVHVHSHSWGERGGVQCPAASTLPPRRPEWLPPQPSPPPRTAPPSPLSPAWSFIIYGRDKIKQTQQNSVKSECRRSHIYTLSCGGGRGQSRAEFVQLLVPASQHPSAARSQVETLY